MPSRSPIDQNPFMALVDAATSMLDAKKEEGESSLTTAPFTITPSGTPPPSSPPLVNEPESAPSSPESAKNVKRESFASTLMNLLLDEQYSKIVTFLPDNQSFGIIDAKQFCDDVMPKVFGIKTFSSFVRKLNRWGFERIMEKKTHDVDVFRHSLFYKNDWKLCAKIRCAGRLSKQQAEAPAPLLRPVPVRAPMVLKSIAAPVQSYNAQALNDMTSQVVGAALETLHRDEKVAQSMTNARMQQLLAQQRLQARMMALRASRLMML